MAKPFKPITDLGLTQEEKERIVRGLHLLQEPGVRKLTDRNTLADVEIEAKKED